MVREKALALLEGRAARLGELLTVAAPDDMVMKEIVLIVQSGIDLNLPELKKALRHQELQNMMFGD